jgi:hypothetical protein
MDIRCGELELVKVNINYWENYWCEYQDEECELEWASEDFRKAFHKELNMGMTLAYEENYNDEHKYYVFDNLLQEYANNNSVVIRYHAQS